MMVVTLCILAVITYLLIGIAFAVILYVKDNAERDEDLVIFDVFAWPLLVLGALLVLTARCTRIVGDWILRLRSAKS
jgi:hypothetical protein